MRENGRMKKQHVQLSDVDRDYLEALIIKGELTTKVYRRALGLLELDRGQTYTAVSKTLKVTIGTLSTWSAKYREIGLQVLQDQPRAGRPVEIDGNQRVSIRARKCTTRFHPKCTTRFRHNVPPQTTGETPRG